LQFLVVEAQSRAAVAPEQPSTTSPAVTPAAIGASHHFHKEKVPRVPKVPVPGVPTALALFSIVATIAWQRAQFETCASAAAIAAGSRAPSVQAPSASASRHAPAGGVPAARSSCFSACSRMRSRSVLTRGPHS
jgi:hypothetical protein